MRGSLFSFLFLFSVSLPLLSEKRMRGGEKEGRTIIHEDHSRCLSISIKDDMRGKGNDGISSEAIGASDVHQTKLKTGSTLDREDIGGGMGEVLAIATEESPGGSGGIDGGVDEDKPALPDRAGGDVILVGDNGLYLGVSGELTALVSSTTAQKLSSLLVPKAHLALEGITPGYHLPLSNVTSVAGGLDRTKVLDLS